MSEFLRFFCVTVIGLVLDITIAFSLAELAGLPLWLAATCGFVVAALANYAMHQLWSFRTGPRRLSALRAAKYGGVALLTLAVRVAIVAWLEALFGDGLALAILLAGAGGSFLVNFSLSKFVVFAQRSEGASS
ncbi:MAG: GtrA family protein [Erythrobacter sp.]|jgi:putative flippase GtrA|nr:GtrA family protein [Erythrobacter sp.]